MSLDNWQKIKPTVEKVALRPTKNDRIEEADFAAQELLEAMKNGADK